MLKFLVLASLSGCATLSQSELLDMGEKLCRCYGGLSVAVECGSDCTKVICRDGTKFDNFYPEFTIVTRCHQEKIPFLTR